MLELKNSSNKAYCELALVKEPPMVTKTTTKKIPKIWHASAWDSRMQNKYGVDDAIWVGYHVIEQTMSIYPRRRCVNMHVMQHYSRERYQACSGAVAVGKVAAVHSSLAIAKQRLHPVSTPELSKLLQRV